MSSTMTISSSSSALGEQAKLAEMQFSLDCHTALLDFKKLSCASHNFTKNQKLEQLKQQVGNGDVEGVKQSLADPLLDLKQVQHTCLATAIKNRNREIFDLILQRKDLDLRYDRTERSLYLIALELPGDDGVYFALELAKKGFNPNPEWDEIQDLIPDNSQFSDLLKHYLDFLEYNENGNNPLHQAILDGDKDLFTQLIKDGHPLNACNKSGTSPLKLALKVWEENPTDPIGKLMVKVLLELGANPNQVSRSDLNFWDSLWMCSPSGWNQLMKKYYRDEARFSSLFLKNFPAVSDGLSDSASRAIQNERVQRSALQTIMGSEFFDDFDGFAEMSPEGCTYQELVVAIHDGVQEFSGQNNSSKEDLEKLKKTLALTELIGKRENYYDQEWKGISQEMLWAQVEKLNLHDDPLFIPINWPSHAIGCVLYKENVILFNRGSKPIDGVSGIHIFKRSKPLSKEAFFTLISRVEKDEEGKFIQDVKDQLGLEEKHVIKLPTQQHGNCSWSSSVSIGIKGVLLALKLNPEHTNCDEVFAQIKPVAKEMNHYIKFRAIDRYVQSIKTLMQTTSESYSEILLGEIVKKLIYKIETKPDCKWYKKALDTIIFSGARMILLRNNKVMRSQDVEKFSKRLAKIYNVSETSLHNEHRFFSIGTNSK